MKKVFLMTLFLLSVTLYGQNQKIPFGSVYVCDTTAGTASAETFTIPTSTPDNWIAYYVVSPALIGADSLKATAILKEANDYGFSAYATVPGRTMTFSQKATAAPDDLYDTISGLRQQVTFTASIDSSAAIYTIYQWYRPLKDVLGGLTLQKTFTLDTLDNSETIYFTLPDKLPYRNHATYYLVATRISGTAAGNIYVQEAADVSGSAYATTSTTAMTNAASVSYRITAVNYGVRQRLKIVGSNTQSVKLQVYAVVKPINNAPDIDRIPPYAFASQTLTNAGTINFALPHKLYSLFDVSYVVKVTKASGTVAGTIYLQEAGDIAGTDYVTSMSASLSDASANYLLNNTAKGLRSRISIVGTGTQSATVTVYAILKPTN